MIRRQLLTAAIAAFLGAWLCNVQQADAASASKSNVTCRDLDELTMKADNVALNNIIIFRKRSFSGKKEFVNVEAVLRNKNEDKRDVAVFIVCYSASKQVVCCASLKPSFDMIPEGTVQTVRGDYYVEEGDTAKITTVDVRLVVR